MTILRGDSTGNSIPHHTLLFNCVAQEKPASPYSVLKRKEKASRHRQSAGALSTRLRQVKFLIRPSTSTSLTMPLHIQGSLRVRTNQPSIGWSGRLRSGTSTITSSVHHSSLRRGGLTQVEIKSNVGVFLCSLIVD